MDSSQAQSLSTARAYHADIIPIDLVAEILCLLPVKPLMRLKRVCKSWKSLIMSPTFAKLHLQKSARTPHLTLMWDPPSDLRFDPVVVPFPVRRILDTSSFINTVPDDRLNRLVDKDCKLLVGSCNGLLCLLTVSLRDDKLDDEYWLRLWNPATKLCSEIFGHFCVPKPKYSEPDPLTVFKFAFGCDNLTGTYKVVAFRLHFFAPHISEVMVCNFGDGNGWRRGQSFSVAPIHGFQMGLNDGVYFNGTLNWIALRDSLYQFPSDAITVDQLVILSLDLGTETEKQLLLPFGFDEVPYDEPHLVVFMNCLCFTHDYRRTEFVVWRMEEFGVCESWSQFLKVSYEALQINVPPPRHWFRVQLLGGSEDGDLLIIVKHGDEHEVTVYNRIDDKAERNRFRNAIYWTLAKDYVESMVSPW